MELLRLVEPCFVTCGPEPGLMFLSLPIASSAGLMQQGFLDEEVIHYR